MVKRCTNPRSNSWKWYGGRGITVCDRWRTFENFLADMGEKPVGRSIDRIDNDLGYFKDDCQWSTPSEQAQNRSKSKTRSGLALSSQYRGVYWDARPQRWRAQVMVGGVLVLDQRFKDEREAAVAAFVARLLNNARSPQGLRCPCWARATGTPPTTSLARCQAAS